MLRILTSIILALCLHSCSKSDSSEMVLFIGAKSTPNYTDLAVDEVVDNFSVAGHGKLGSEDWGTLSITYSSSGPYTLTSGGCVTWTPKGEDLIKLSGSADVDLYAYYFETDSSRDLTKVILRKKWHIEPGTFDIPIN